MALDKLTAAGAVVSHLPDGFRVQGPRRARAVDAATLPYPGFPTDLQPFMITLDAVAEGAALVTENLFEARFRFVQEIARLGADVRVDGHHALVRGVPRLSGRPVEASDIRAGAALVLAGLVADGETLRRGRAARRPRLRRHRHGAARPGRRRQPDPDPRPRLRLIRRPDRRPTGPDPAP